MSIQDKTLTASIISYRKNRLNNRLVFGAPILRVRRGWRREIAAFEPGQIFAYERWSANKYGTQDWRIYICLAANTSEEITEIPGILPGAILLADAIGKTRSKQFLRLIGDIKNNRDIQLEDISEDRWRSIGNAIHNGETPTLGRTVYV